MNADDFERVLEQSLDAYLIVDSASDIIRYANPAMARLVGYEAQELVGRSFFDLTPPPAPPPEEHLVRDVRHQDGVLLSQEFMYVDGTTCLLDVTATLVELEVGLSVVMCLRDSRPRVEEEEARERLLRERAEALSKVKLLSGLLPICSSCKRIRDDEGYWKQIEHYIRDHSEADFSHSLCPECLPRYFPSTLLETE